MNKHVFTALLLGLCISASAQIERLAGTQHIRPAYTIHRGYLYAQAQMRFFFQDEIMEIPSGLLSGETYWDIQNGLQLSYGLSDVIELRLLQIIYQDNHKMNSGYNLPDDLFLSAQTHIWKNSPANFRVGGQFDIRFPLAAHHNLPLEPYSGDRIGVGFSILASWLSRADAPAAGLTLSANLGIFNHNDRGEQITNVPGNTISADHNTLETNYGLAVQQTLGSFVFFAELYGKYFLQKPAVTAYTRENSLYLSPGMTVTLPSQWRLRAAVDLRLTGDHDETDYGTSSPHHSTVWYSLPNHPDWRINFALQLPIYPALFIKHPEDSKQDAVRRALRAQSEEEVLDELIREQQKSEKAEKDLARIQAERKRIEEALKKVNELLEPAAPQKKPDKEQ